MAKYDSKELLIVRETQERQNISEHAYTFLTREGASMVSGLRANEIKSRFIRPSVYCSMGMGGGIDFTRCICRVMIVFDSRRKGKRAEIDE